MIHIKAPPFGPHVRRHSSGNLEVLSESRSFVNRAGIADKIVAKITRGHQTPEPQQYIRFMGDRPADFVDRVEVGFAPELGPKDVYLWCANLALAGEGTEVLFWLPLPEPARKAAS